MWIPFGKPGALARVAGSNRAPCLFGSVKFYEVGENVLVVADVSGLPQSKTGIFGMHIHAGGSCSGKELENTGSHYNPTKAAHPDHAGDLPPLVSCNGKAFLAVLTDRFRIPDVMGRTVVIHASPDDFTSQPAGNAGDRIACGIIALY